VVRQPADATMRVGGAWCAPRPSAGAQFLQWGDQPSSSARSAAHRQQLPNALLKAGVAVGGGVVWRGLVLVSVLGLWLPSRRLTSLSG
jgi:hypothetical protein